MKIILCICFIFLLNLINLHKIVGKPVHEKKQNHLTESSDKTNSDTFMYLTKYGYNPCGNQYESTKTKRPMVSCQTDLKLMIKDFQARHRLPITGKVDLKTKKLMDTPRCGLQDKPLAFSIGARW